jgi:hypothetical protein
MSDEDILNTIRISMGKCAIMVLQDQGTAAWQQREHPASAATVSTDSRDQQSGHERCSGHPQLNAACCPAQTGPRMSPAAGAVSAARAAAAAAAAGPQQCNAVMHSFGSADSASTAVHAGAACGVASCIPWDVGPAFEVSAIFAMLFNWDTDRFMRIAGLDLETGETGTSVPAGWLALLCLKDSLNERKLRFSKDMHQLERIHCLLRS